MNKKITKPREYYHYLPPETVYYQQATLNHSLKWRNCTGAGYSTCPEAGSAWWVLLRPSGWKPGQGSQ